MAIVQRPVDKFDSVLMQDFGVLRIQQGEQESLTVESDSDTLDKVLTEVREGELVLRLGRDWMQRLRLGLHTSLTRPRIEYSLTVRELKALTMAGFGQVDVGALATDQLALTLSGGGSITAQDLTAQRLRVKLTGAGRIEITGQAKEQSVQLAGAGEYAGAKLQTERARVDVTGAGHASVWATEDLDMSVSGLGSVEYTGSPRVRKKVSGVGSIRAPSPPKPPFRTVAKEQ